MSNPIRIKAMFTGSAGSLGYEGGKTYNLFLDTKCENFWWRKTEVVIWDADKIENPKPCEYGSVKSFLANWSLVVTSDKSPLYNTVHALLQTKHPRVIFALENALEKEKEYLKRPSTRFDAKKLVIDGIDEKDIAASRILAEESINQFEHTLTLLRSNEFIVGSNELEESLRKFARVNFAEMDSEKFATDVMDNLKKKLS